MTLISHKGLKLLVTGFIIWLYLYLCVYTYKYTQDFHSHPDDKSEQKSALAKYWASLPYSQLTKWASEVISYARYLIQLVIFSSKLHCGVCALFDSSECWREGEEEKLFCTYWATIIISSFASSVQCKFSAWRHELQWFFLMWALSVRREGCLELYICISLKKGKF